MAKREPTTSKHEHGTFIPWTGDVTLGVFRRRYKRFFADVSLHGVGDVTAHTPNTGAMTGLTNAGAKVIVTRHDNPKRRLAWSLEAVFAGQSWVCTNTYVANRLVKEAILAGDIAGLDHYESLQTEKPFPDGGRVDLFLSEHEREPDVWVEVKSVTLREGELATWPDAVSERGRRHLASLRDRVRAGERAVMLYVVHRADVQAFAPAASVDPQYAGALYDAYTEGVEVMAIQAVTTERGVAVGRRLPVVFQPLT